jgi:hypothetical protein
MFMVLFLLRLEQGESNLLYTDFDVKLLRVLGLLDDTKDDLGLLLLLLLL